MMNRRLVRLIPLLLCLLLAACSLPGSQGQDPGPTTTAAEAVATSTSTPQPSETPLPPSVFLIASPTADQMLAASLQEKLTALAGEAGLHFEARQELAAADLAGIDMRLAVLLGVEDSVVSSLALAAPEAQFLTIGPTTLQAGANLSVLKYQSQRADLQAFVAGFIAAAVTEDWRVGVLREAGTANGKAALNGYTNGVYFFCGLCRPVYPPFPIPGYPLSWELPAGSGAADWDPALAYFQEWNVKTIYVADPLATEPLLDSLAASGFNLIAGVTPPAAAGTAWVATVGSADPLQAIETLWPDLLAGQGGKQLDLALSISHANPSLFSPGRQEYVARMLADLQGGFIDTGVDPATGEMR